MASQASLDRLYMDIAERIAQQSSAVRAKVGAVIVKNDNIISMGWNGTPAGDDNECETREYMDRGAGGWLNPDEIEMHWPFLDADSGRRYCLKTKPEVLHAESNALMKLVAAGSAGSEGATLYVTMSPCADCAKLIKQAKIRRVVYRVEYRDRSGIEFLRTRRVQVDLLN